MFRYHTVNLSFLARYHYRSVIVPSCFRDRPVLNFSYRPPNVHLPLPLQIYRYRPFTPVTQFTATNEGKGTVNEGTVTVDEGTVTVYKGTVTVGWTMGGR